MNINRNGTTVSLEDIREYIIEDTQRGDWEDAKEFLGDTSYIIHFAYEIIRLIDDMEDSKLKTKEDEK